MPVVRGIRVLNAISTGNVTPTCLDTLLSNAGRLADVTQVLSSPSYSCMLAQSNNAAYTAVRSNNAMTAIFANPIASCIMYTTANGREDMLGSSCYYNYMMSFSTPEATNAFTHFGNTPCMINCAFASCTAFLNTAVTSNTEIAKLLTCNSCISACFRGSACAMQQAVGTPGRPAYWLGDATAFSCLSACTTGLGTAFGNTVFLNTLNRDIACVMCTPALNCCAWGLASPANTYTYSTCAIDEVVTKGACCLNYTSCNFVCWYDSTYGVPCTIQRLNSTGNTYFLDQVYTLNSWRQKSCLFYMCDGSLYCSCVMFCPTCTKATNAQCLVKSEIIQRGGFGCWNANNEMIPLSLQATYGNCNYTNYTRFCPFTIANGSQLSNTEIEYLGKFSKCNYNVITHGSCLFTLISPGFWNTSNMIACFRNCYCCAINRTTANTSGLTLNCGLYYTTDNGASFNRLCVSLPACIFQQVCGNCCCMFSVRYALSSFACCNYVYTGWIISDCSTAHGAAGGPAFFKTGHSRVCLFANSQPNTASWTHFPDVPLPFYTVTFCEDYFAGVSPMRTDGYQTTLGLCNQVCCSPAGQYAMMFSFGRVGDCVRVSCDNFILCQPTNVCCFCPATCCFACQSLPAITHCNFGTAHEDFFQMSGGGSQPYCWFDPYIGSTNTPMYGTIVPQPGGQPSQTLIWKHPTCAADSKAFLAGWRTPAMQFGGACGAACCTCMVIDGKNHYMLYNCCNQRGISEIYPYGCNFFVSSPGLNVWCYGSQANNTMQGSEITCEALGGNGSSSWTNWSFSNVKIVGNTIVMAGNLPPRVSLCCIYSCNAGNCYLYSAVSGGCLVYSGYYGCHGPYGQLAHTTVMNTDGVVGTMVCCLDSMYRQIPMLGQTNDSYNGCINSNLRGFGWCSGCYQACVSICYGMGFGTNPAREGVMAGVTVGLRHLNFYGSGNSIFTTLAFPNESPTCFCYGCGCYDSAITCCAGGGYCGGFTVNRLAMCVQDLGEFVCHCIGMSTTFGCANCYAFNPGSANTLVLRFCHSSGTDAIHPACFGNIYVPPSANQNMTQYNFCYVLTPNHDNCLEGPYCWCEGCAITCPACNCVFCCFSNSLACCSCFFTRANGYEKMQAMCSHSYCTYPPGCCGLISRNPLNCSASGGLNGFGNQFNWFANSNNTFQCASSLYMTYGYQFNSIGNCYCSSGNACYWCSDCAQYSPSLRTCNQSGGNCMWYDFIPNATAGSPCSAAVQGVPYYIAYIFNACTYGGFCFRDMRNECCTCYYGLPYGTKIGILNTPADCSPCAFSIACPAISYPFCHSRLTRGAGAMSNLSNSIHLAWFDLVPFKCCIQGSAAFYANGNACPVSSCLACCMMYVKKDLFANF